MSNSIYPTNDNWCVVTRDLYQGPVIKSSHSTREEAEAKAIETANEVVAQNKITYITLVHINLVTNAITRFASEHSGEGDCILQCDGGLLNLTTGLISKAA